MDFSKLNLLRLTPEHTIKSFDCEDSDLNEFLFEDAKNHLSDLFAVTYLLETKENTVAFFSLLNDKISYKETRGRTIWQAFKEEITQSSPLASFPAMKIGRLGVSKEFKSNGVGTFIVDYLKVLFVTNNRTGCRFITADAYNDSLSFHEKNNFKYLTDKDKNRDTRLMYFDLKPIV